MRRKYPKLYKIYQEIIGEAYYELLCLGVVFRYLSLKKLYHLEQNLSVPIDVLFNFSWPKPYCLDTFQNKQEVHDFLELIGNRRFNVICEIGTDNGGNFYLWSKLLQPGGLIISIDLPGLYRKSINRFLVNLVTNERQAHFIREDSHSLRCVEKLERVLDGRKIDFLFIDGDHSYGGIKQDFDNYSKFVRKEGVIAIHDIAVTQSPGITCGVPECWNEIKNQYNYKEIISKIGGCGIGLLMR